jgi:hypothetical protein
MRVVCFRIKSVTSSPVNFSRRLRQFIFPTSYYRFSLLCLDNETPLVFGNMYWVSWPLTSKPCNRSGISALSCPLLIQKQTLPVLSPCNNRVTNCVPLVVVLVYWCTRKRNIPMALRPNVMTFSRQSGNCRQAVVRFTMSCNRNDKYV